LYLNIIIEHLTIRSVHKKSPNDIMFNMYKVAHILLRVEGDHLLKPKSYFGSYYNK